MDEINGIGASLVAISPQTVENNAEIARKQRLTFPVLSDHRNAYSGRLNLAYPLPFDLREIYQDFGIDLEDTNGEDTWTLPLPTRLIVDRDGLIRHVDADPDYTVRPEPVATVEGIASL